MSTTLTGVEILTKAQRLDEIAVIVQQGFEFWAKLYCERRSHAKTDVDQFAALDGLTSYYEGNAHAYGRILGHFGIPAACPCGLCTQQRMEKAEAEAKALSEITTGEQQS